MPRYHLPPSPSPPAQCSRPVLQLETPTSMAFAQRASWPPFCNLRGCRRLQPVGQPNKSQHPNFYLSCSRSWPRSPSTSGPWAGRGWHRQTPWWCHSTLPLGLCRGRSSSPTSFKAKRERESVCVHAWSFVALMFFFSTPGSYWNFCPQSVPSPQGLSRVLVSGGGLKKLGNARHNFPCSFLCQLICFKSGYSAGIKS